MAEETKRVSILDQLKAGAVVIAASGSGEGESAPMVEASSDASAGTGEPEPAAGGAPPAGEFDDDFAAPADSPAGSSPAGGFFNQTDERFEDGGDVPRDSLGRSLENKRGPRPGKAKTNIGLIERLLIGIHTMGSAALKSPHWELTADEANELAKAMAGVQAQYDVSLDPKTEAWLNLATVAGAMYVPRVLVTMHLVRETKKAQPKEPPPEKPLQQGGSFQASTGMRPNPQEALTPSQLFGPGMNGMVPPTRN